jgi:hypothetical protein
MDGKHTNKQKDKHRKTERQRGIIEIDKKIVYSLNIFNFGAEAHTRERKI